MMEKSSIDIVQIIRYGPRRFSPGAEFSFPSEGDIEYSFTPRPMTYTPITKHMFNDLFYACYDKNTIAHRLHSLSSLCDHIVVLADDLVGHIPKRDRLVVADARGDKVEIFWGLVAREQRSALRVSIYMLISLIPSIWFAFAWLFGWGHAGDLQDATVPLTLTVAMLGMLWTVVYSGSDVGQD